MRELQGLLRQGDAATEAIDHPHREEQHSGKSVLARPPLLLAHGLSRSAETPVELVIDGLDFGNSHLDLIHGRLPHGAISLGLTLVLADNTTADLEVKIQHFDEYKLLHVSFFQWSVTGVGSIALSWEGEDPLRDPHTYKESNRACHQVQFDGLLPRFGAVTRPERETQWHLEQARPFLEALIERISYLGPFRETPERAYRYPGGSPSGVGFRGQRAPDLLGDDHLRRRGALLDSVSKWLERYLNGWRLGISTSSSDNFSLVARHPDNPALEVNLVDLGAGIGQVLPIGTSVESPSTAFGRQECDQAETHKRWKDS